MCDARTLKWLLSSDERETNSSIVNQRNKPTQLHIEDGEKDITRSERLLKDAYSIAVEQRTKHVTAVIN